MINNTNVNNGVQTTEGMDDKMNKLTGVKSANLGNVLKGTGLTEEVIRDAVTGLGLTFEGKKIVNILDTATVVQAIKEYVVAKEVAATNEGMDDKMDNRKKAKEIIRKLKAETKVYKYRTSFITVEDYNDYQEAIKMYRDDKVLLNKLDKVQNKRKLVLKIIDQLAEGKFSYKMYNAVMKYKYFLTQSEFETAESSFDAAMVKSSIKNYKNILAVKRWSKDIPVALLRRVVCFSGKTLVTEVAPQMISSLLRACDLTEKTVADSSMSLEGLTTDELLLFSFDKDVLKVNGNNKRENIKKKDYLSTIFHILAGSIEQKIYLVERKSGIADVYINAADIKLKEGEVIKQYEFLGITPSGLRSGTMTLGITKEIHKDGTIIDRDRRIEIMDKSSDNSFSKNFVKGYDENGKPIFKGCDSLLDAFKDMSRMMLSATSSKVLGTIGSLLVLDNISHNAGHNVDKNKYNIPCNAGDEGFVDCSDTSDGFGEIAADFALDRLHASDIPCSTRDLLGMLFQVRGGGLKIAGMLKNKNDMKLDAKAALLRGAKILKAVHNGVELNVEDLLKDEALLNDFLNNIEGLFDKNGMKLLEHDEKIELVVLKKAYSSDSKLSDVLNIIMMIADEKATTKLLSNRVKHQILDKLKDMGISMDYDEATDSVSNVRCDFDSLQRVNNDPQIIEWLTKSLPRVMSAAAPGAIKTSFNGLLKGVANLVNELNVEVDCEYLVVQSDAAVRFGVRLLHEDEVFCPSLATADKVSAVRHPVSNIFAVSTFKPVSLETIFNRIKDLQVSTEIKDMLFSFYKEVDGYAVIPASHFYMEKHDGMDFDIDAMQFFLDKDVVNILSKVSDVGTIIDRELDEAVNGSTEFTADDNAIKVFQETVKEKKFGPIPYDDNEDIKEEGFVASKPKGIVNIGKRTVIKKDGKNYKPNAEGKYSLDFSSVAMMVLDYFLNPIDSVGTMATNFYNNGKILMALKSSNKEITKEMKSFIVKGMKTMFSCYGVSNYVSPIIKPSADGKDFDWNVRNKIILCKDVCHQVIKAFVNSKGSFEDCKAFLLDACICSRYPAETSIDSAKKMYKVINMFALSGCIKAMGAKSAIKFVNFDPFKVDEDGNKVEEQDSIEAFNQIITLFNGEVTEENPAVYESNNFFDLKLLKEDINCVAWDGVSKASVAFNTKGKVAGIVDPIYILKNNLMNFANSVIVYAAKELEAYVKSDEADNIRTEIKKHCNAEDEFFRVDKVISNIVGTYITLTESIKMTEEDELDDVTAKKYLKTNALQACRNTAILHFKTAKRAISDEEIGAGVFYYMITSYEKNLDKCTSVNTKILTIFQKEVLAFLASIGHNVIAAEEIQYAVNPNTNRHIKVSELEGSTCSAYKGNGQVETDNGDQYLLVMKSKKATFENGEVITIDDKSFVAQERKTLENNIQTGFYFGAKMEKGIFNKVKTLMNKAKSDSYCDEQYRKLLADINVNNMLADCEYEKVVFKIKTLRDENNSSYKANLLVGIKDNKEYLIAELYTNTVVSKLLNDTTLSLDNIKLFMTEDSCTVNIINDDLLAEVEDAMVEDVIDDHELFETELDDATETTSTSTDSFDDGIKIENTTTEQERETAATVDESNTSNDLEFEDFE